MIDYIKLDQCKKGYLYRINSRNLSFGVYDGNEGFIGIRTKFSDRYLFTEYHYDQGAPFGTVFPISEIGPIPADIEPIENAKLFAYLDEWQKQHVIQSDEHTKHRSHQM